MNSAPDNYGNSAYQELLDKLQALEQRVSHLEIERKRSYSSGKTNIEDEGQSVEFSVPDDAQLESSFGEYGLAWLGNIVLFFGITFLVQYMQVNGYKFLSPILGYISVGGIFFLAHYLRSSNSYMARIFNLNAYLLLFYVTLKLHFFTTNPILQNSTLGLFLLLIVAGVFLFLAKRNKSKAIAGMALILITVIGVLSDSTHIMLPLITLVSIIAVFLLSRLGWLWLVNLSIFLVYFTYLLWLLDNPAMGHQMQAISNHQFGFIYLFLIAGTYSFIALMPKREELYSSEGIIGSTVFNGLGFAFVLAMITLSFFKKDYVLLMGSVALFCILYSIVLQLRSNWKITAALYALFGYVTLSAGIYGLYAFPRAYFLLAIQSLLVVSMAIWFRSKFIIFMNSALFVILLLVYLSTSESGNGMNVSFSVVALATARILNWKKERLTIKTEFIRNFYLFIAFFMVLFTLYHMVPNQYITLSWTLAAVLYFVFSLILKNVKYRYMALATMIAAALHLFISDLARIELVFRVVALLFLAVISIGLSFYYAKKVKGKKD